MACGPRQLCVHLHISYNRMTGSVPFFTWLDARLVLCLSLPVTAALARRAWLLPALRPAVSTPPCSRRRRLYLSPRPATMLLFAATSTRRLIPTSSPPVVGDLVWFFTPRLFRTTEDFAEFHTFKSQNRFGDHPRLVTKLYPIFSALRNLTAACHTPSCPSSRMSTSPTAWATVRKYTSTGSLLTLTPSLAMVLMAPAWPWASPLIVMLTAAPSTWSRTSLLRATSYLCHIHRRRW